MGEGVAPDASGQARASSGFTTPSSHATRTRAQSDREHQLNERDPGCTLEAADLARMDRLGQALGLSTFQPLAPRLATPPA
jgi:hypothetical protein